jgi:hypothetical protein
MLSTSTKGAEMTLAIDHAGTTTRERRSRSARSVKWQSWSFRLFLAGFVALIASAWGGIVAFVGPTFGFSADGTGSWHWDLSHALLALIPGAMGCVVGVALMGYSRSRSRTFLGLGVIGLLAVVSGAWFAIGPLAWPVLYGSRSYFVGATPLRELAYLVGYSLGPALILAVAGGIAWGSETAVGASAYQGATTEDAAPADAPAEVAPAAAAVAPAVPTAAPAPPGPAASTPAPAPAAVPEAPFAPTEAEPRAAQPGDEAAPVEAADSEVARNEDATAPGDEGAPAGTAGAPAEKGGDDGATMPA